MQDNVRVCIPRYLQIGKRSVEKLPEILKTIGVKKPLIITDKMMVEIGNVAKITAYLDSDEFEYGVFDETVPDPTDLVIAKGLAALREGGYDSVIGLGGGSPIDTAKAIAVLSQHSDNILDYRPPMQFNEKGGLPIIAIPTTAGTGSEVTHHTVIVHSATQEKISCRGEAFVPTAAIIDYELTLSKPQRLTVDNALDTLTHGIEAYVSTKASFFSDRIALDCMRLVGQYIKRAANDGSDLRAREGLMLAATMGGIAFTNASICLVHGMSRPLGSFFHVPHGLSNAMLLPYITSFSLKEALPRYADCSRAIGFAATNDSNAVAADKLIDGLFAYLKDLNIPSISEFGVDASEFEEKLHSMAEDALRSGAPNLNPRIPSQAEIIELYRQAW
ncbi:MAG: alcohol dehydrogenase class IV [Cellvibrionaceae bacterium]|jgi:alcohol dehydrogenase class IV